MASKKHQRIEIDASGLAPGRIATQVASYLIGKHRVSYTPHIDTGGAVVVTNADKAKFTGKKVVQKLYRHHTMHPGGLKEIPAKKIVKENPVEVIRHAVSKMLPRNKFRTQRLRRLSFK